MFILKLELRDEAEILTNNKYESLCHPSLQKKQMSRLQNDLDEKYKRNLKFATL